MPPEPDGARSAQDDGEQRPIDQVIDDGGRHAQSADAPSEDAEIHQNPGQHRVRSRQVHAHEQGEGEEVGLHCLAPQVAGQPIDQRHAPPQWAPTCRPTR